VTPPALPSGVLFGAAYYAEYQPYDRLEQDLDLMLQAEFTVIRVGESVWSTWEPRDGEFDLDWLQPVLDAAYERGIKAIVGTPTYAAPPWLRRRYPETAAHPATGQARPYGARQDINHPHPAFRYLAERLIRKMVPRYADHPAVIGWQVDNEPGINVLHNPAVFDGFREYLRDRYGDVEELNRRWGLTYWSHRLHDWADLWTPDGNSTPPYDLAWRRYQAELTHEYIAWQAELVRSLVPDEQFVFTCLAPHQPTQDVTVIGAPLDIVATNVYYAPQDRLAVPGPDDITADPQPSFLPWSGTAWLYEQLDLARGTRQAPFLVAETNATSIGGSAENYTPYRGQLRQTVWAQVARGARMVEYWHWHTQHYGAEMYWGGILGHSLQPGRIYAELAAVAGELKRVGPALDDLRPRADVAVLVSAESRWAMEFVGPLRGPRRRGWATRSPTSGSSPRSTAGSSTPAWRWTSSRRDSCPRPRARRRRGGRCSSSRGSTSRTTGCSRGWAATRRPAGTSCSPPARAMRPRRASPATRSCRARCARRPARTTSSTPTSRGPSRSWAPRGSPARRRSGRTACSPRTPRSSPATRTPTSRRTRR
jgi:beta-galactosidase